MSCDMVIEVWNFVVLCTIKVISIEKTASSNSSCISWDQWEILFHDAKCYVTNQKAIFVYVRKWFVCAVLPTVVFRGDTFLS